MSKPSAASRLARSSPAAQSEARVVGGEGAEVAAVKDIRVTVDLAPDDYEQLAQFALAARSPRTDVLRALIRLLDDEVIAGQIRKSLRK